MKLKVLSKYRSRETFYQAGSEIEVTEAEAATLMVDSPGTFEEVKPEPKKEAKAKKTTTKKGK